MTAIGSATAPKYRTLGRVLDGTILVFIAGGRILQIEEVAARIAERAPYVAIHARADPDPRNVDPTPSGTGLDDYVEIFNRDGVRPLRYDHPRDQT